MNKKKAIEKLRDLADLLEKEIDNHQVICMIIQNDPTHKEGIRTDVQITE